MTFEVTAPTFKPGNVNYICMVDGEGRASNTDVEDFKLEPSIKVVPASVSTAATRSMCLPRTTTNDQRRA